MSNTEGLQLCDVKIPYSLDHMQIIITILKIHFGEIRNEQSPYNVPGSKCKHNQRKNLHIHTHTNSGKAYPRKRDSV